MNIEYMRTKVQMAYQSPRWMAKVNRMKDNQVIALYYRFKEDGLFEMPKRKGEGRQLSMKDVFGIDV